MGNLRRIRYIAFVGVCLFLTVIEVATVDAVVSTSPNFRLEGTTGNSINSIESSANYGLVSSGGESVIGNGSAGSYKLGQGYSSKLQRSLQLTVQPNSLGAYFSLDEPSGNIAFDSANGFVAASTNPPDRVPGLIGNAIGPIASGSGKFLTTVDGSNNLDTPNFTACSWVYRTAASANPIIVGRADGPFNTDGMWTLGFGNFATPRFVIQLNGTNNALAANTTAAYNAWQQVCGSYDGSTMRIYVNGALSGSQALAGPLPGLSSQPISIGARSNGAGPSDTQSIDEVKVFYRVLSDDEVLAEYRAGIAGIPAGLSLGNLTPGVSSTKNFDTTIQADGTGYNLSINQNQNLTSGSNTISAVSGASIAAPLLWVEGTTKGLGFSLSGTNATAIPGKWMSGNAYAPLPSTGTTFYSRTGTNSSNKDVINMRLRVDIPNTQAQGSYSNQMTITGTITP